MLTVKLSINKEILLELIIDSTKIFFFQIIGKIIILLYFPLLLGIKLLVFLECDIVV